MLLAERIEGAEPSRNLQRVAKLNRSADRALREACVGWRRSVRDFDRAVSAAASGDDNGKRFSNALQLGDETTGWTQEISHIRTVTVEGLQDKVGICVDALKQCGDQPAKHIDDLVLSCLTDAKQILAAPHTATASSPVLEATAACNSTLAHFNDNLLALQGEDLSTLEERACISKLALRNEELMEDIFRLTQLSAISPEGVVAKGDALRRLIDAGHWECLHRRDLAISYCNDLRDLLASSSKNPSLFSRASRMMVSLTRR